MDVAADMNGFVKVATLTEVPEGYPHLVEVGLSRIALFNLGGEIHALEDMCTHDGGPLVEGDLIDGQEVQCPRHGARFDIRTGAALCMPAFQPAVKYETRVDGTDIWVAVPD
ncbi:MAG: non-heme iron oxygenase ferredoxin subunit [Caldilineaceae bacterium]|nr:non-heme iron oxygenase ferredoxin subunit [Caldilineaceae bacterium]